MLWLVLPSSALGNSFQAEGSDLLMGVGAKQIGLGGAVVAGVNDIYAIYWNPAGLAEMDQSQLSSARQLNARLIPVNFLGLGLASEALAFGGLKSTLAVAWVPRLHVTASGAFSESDLESVFLRYALPGLPGDFDGDIESKTKDYRISWAITPRHHARWSLGITLSRIECATTFCGVTAEDPGNYTIVSTNATAYSINLGAKYYVSDALRFGLNFKDVDTQLDVEVEVTDQQGTERRVYQVPFPRDLTLGLLWQHTHRLALSLDYQNLFGEYGDYQIDFKLLRGGLAYTGRWLDYRMGLIGVLQLDSDKLDNIREKLPAPVAPTAGIGWQGQHLSIDLALYAHPIMSYQRRRLYPAAEVSLSYRF